MKAVKMLLVSLQHNVSASGVTTLWRYANLFIIIIFLSPPAQSRRQKN